MKFDIHKKEWDGQLYENGKCKKIVGHSKLKLWTCLWIESECESLNFRFLVENVLEYMYM